MQNLGNVYILGSPFVMSRTDAQNGVEIIFKWLVITANEDKLEIIVYVDNVIVLCKLKFLMKYIHKSVN